MINNIFDLNFRKLKMTQKAGRAPGGAQGENGAGSDTQPLETGLSVPDKEICSVKKTLKVATSRSSEVDATESEREVDKDEWLSSEHIKSLYLSLFVEKIKSLQQRHYARNVQFGFGRLVIHAVATASLADQASVDSGPLPEKREGRHKWRRCA